MYWLFQIEDEQGPENKDYFEPLIMQSYFLEAVNRNAEHMNVWERVTVHVFAGSTAVLLTFSVVRSKTIFICLAGSIYNCVFLV